MATAPFLSGFAETNSSRRVLGSPLWCRVGPWPVIRGVNEELVLVDQIRVLTLPAIS
jgi:hypothetical protein